MVLRRGVELLLQEGTFSLSINALKILTSFNRTEEDLLLYDQNQYFWHQMYPAGYHS
jgi:hypothetical protein